MAGIIAAKTQRIVNKTVPHPSLSRSGFGSGPGGKDLQEADSPASAAPPMFLITSSPKPEVVTRVAPGIRR